MAVDSVELVIRGRDVSAGQVIRGVHRQLGELGQGATQLRGGFSQLASGLATPFRAVSGVLGSVLNMQNLVLAGAGAMAAKAVFSPAMDLERWRTELGVFLGSTEAAEARIAELAAFSASTPFQMPGIIQASKILETLTGGAISTGAGLTMVGDVAAATGQPIEELAVWFGRLYDGIQSGRPVGEAMARLSELGVISGQTRGMLENMQKTGAAGPAIWAAFTSELGRFDGMMREVSQTSGGKLSTMADNWFLLRSKVGEGAIPALIEIVDDLTATITELSESGELAEFGQELGDFLKTAYVEGKQFAAWVDENKDWLIKLGVTAVGTKMLVDTAVGIAQITTAMKALAAVQVPTTIAGLLQMGATGAGAAGATAGAAGGGAAGAAGAGAAGMTVGTLAVSAAAVTLVAGSLFVGAKKLTEEAMNVADAEAQLREGRPSTVGEDLMSTARTAADFAVQGSGLGMILDALGVDLNRTDSSTAPIDPTEVRLRRFELEREGKLPPINIDTLNVNANDAWTFVESMEREAGAAQL